MKFVSGLDAVVVMDADTAFVCISFRKKREVYATPPFLLKLGPARLSGGVGFNADQQRNPTQP